MSVLEPSYHEVKPRFHTSGSSHGRGWNQVQVYCYELERQLDPVAIPIIDAHMIPVVLAGRSTASTHTGGRVLRDHVFPGSMSLMPSGVPMATSWTHALVMGHVYLSAELVGTIAEELGRSAPELIPHSYFRDPFIEQLCFALIGEVETTAPLGALYADTLAQALGLHLLRKYSTATILRDGPRRGLSHRRLKLVTDYVEDRLATEVSLGELAAVAGLSPAHFSRQFKAATGMPPHQFLIHRRVERAKELLSRGGMSIAEVSQAVGFFDQSHLARHFKRIHNASPNDVMLNRKNVRS